MSYRALITMIHKSLSPGLEPVKVFWVGNAGDDLDRAEKAVHAAVYEAKGDSQAIIREMDQRAARRNFYTDEERDQWVATYADQRWEIVISPAPDIGDLSQIIINGYDACDELFFMRKLEFMAPN